MRTFALYSALFLTSVSLLSAQMSYQTRICLSEWADLANPSLMSDERGGAIIAWEDPRNAYTDIYAQRVDSNGLSQWTNNGVKICGAPRSQTEPILVTDGSGGAIIAWKDGRIGGLYAQRISSDGVVQWLVDGIAICSATGLRYGHVLISDGKGGIIIAWEDYRNTTGDIYAQHVNANGEIQWTGNGLAICSAPGGQFRPALIGDGKGGAIIVWDDERDIKTNASDIYMQRIDSNGTIQWMTDGIPICTAPGNQIVPKLIDDGGGGAIITWTDGRAYIPNPDDILIPDVEDIYAQRVNARGEIQWDTNGVAISTAPEYQAGPQIIADGKGGAIITWQDFKNGTPDIYAQRINENGVAQWAESGIPIAVGPSEQAGPRIVEDGRGGAYITWSDGHINAQHITAEGDTSWSSNGIPLSPGYPYMMVSDARGGAIVSRSWGVQVWVLKLHSLPLPVVLTSFIAQIESVGINLQWHTATEVNNSGFEVERGSLQYFNQQGGTDEWENIGRVEGSGTTNSPHSYFYIDENAQDGYVYRLKQISYDGQSMYSQVVEPEIIPVGVKETDGSIPREIVLEQNYPNPFNPSTTIEYILPGACYITLGLFDMLGREIRILDEGIRAPGKHSLVLHAGDLASGVYLCRLNALNNVQSKKIMIIK
jgi:hypothetical protein